MTVSFGRRAAVASRPHRIACGIVVVCVPLPTGSTTITMNGPIRERSYKCVYSLRLIQRFFSPNTRHRRFIVILFRPISNRASVDETSSLSRPFIVFSYYNVHNNIYCTFRYGYETMLITKYKRARTRTHTHSNVGEIITSV